TSDAFAASSNAIAAPYNSAKLAPSIGEKSKERKPTKRVSVLAQMARPQAAQKWAPTTLSVPHWLQNRPELATGTKRTGTGLTSPAQAQIKAAIHPTTVQPRRRFRAKIAPASDLFRPMMVGRK